MLCAKLLRARFDPFCAGVRFEEVTARLDVPRFWSSSCAVVSGSLPMVQTQGFSAIRRKMACLTRSQLLTRCESRGMRDAIVSAARRAVRWYRERRRAMVRFAPIKPSAML